MIYREYLVMRKAIAWYAIVLLALMLLQVITMRKTGATINFGNAVSTAGVLAAFFAWIFGVALGNASREAARVLWVLPAERWKLALQLIGVDLIGVTVAFACEFAIMLLLIALASLRFKVGILITDSANEIILMLALVYATYGWSALLGMVVRRVPYCALISAPALAIWMTLAESHNTIGAMLRAPIVVNPIATVNTFIAVDAYRQSHAGLDAVSTSLLWLGTTWETPVLFAVALVTCAAAVVLWQRAQTISA